MPCASLNTNRDVATYGRLFSGLESTREGSEMLNKNDEVKHYSGLQWGESIQLKLHLIRNNRNNFLAKSRILSQSKAGEDKHLGFVNDASTPPYNMVIAKKKMTFLFFWCLTFYVAQNYKALCFWWKYRACDVSHVGRRRSLHWAMQESQAGEASEWF